LLSSATLSIGCALRPPAAERSADRHPVAADVRPPVQGQSWRYAKHDGITGELIDVQVDRVSTIDHTVQLDSWRETGNSASRAELSSCGAECLHPIEGATSRPVSLPSEVQKPWGMILVDPHWDMVQVYRRPLPLWPAVLRPGWRSLVNTQYQTAEATDLPWQLTMKVHGWESVTVPAGQFMALRYTNLINFRHSDFSRTDAVRQEALWLAPEVGRWVVRESRGSYYHDDSVGDQPYSENSYRWELLNWS